jgi:hypothetical protein
MEKLLEYQQVDAELKAVENELSSNEDRKKGIAAKKFLDTVNDSLAELDAKIRAMKDTLPDTTEEFELDEDDDDEFDIRTLDDEL